MTHPLDAQSYLNNLAKDLRPKPKALPKLVGIAGKAGTGKDTLADFLVYRHGYIKYAFADPIKNMVSSMLGLPTAYWLDRDWKEAELIGLGTSPRKLAQTLGTEWGRDVEKGIWLKLFTREWETRYKNIPQGVVISDIRFDNEAKLCRSLGGCVVNLTRPGAAAVATHSSEAGIRRNKRNVDIVNTGTIREYQEAAEAALASWSIRG